MGESIMKTAIIGGGVGGLVTALLLSKRGFQVDIFEKEERLGGRLAFVERDGYRIDEGPTIVLLPEMLMSILDEAGIGRDRYELIPCDPLYTLHFPDGSTYTKFADIQKQLKEIKQKFPGEEENFMKFLEEMNARFLAGKRAFLEKSFVRKRDFWTVRNMKTLWEMKAYQSVQAFTSSYFQDDRLRQAYALQTLYIGGNPLSAPAMYSLIPYSEHEHGIYYVKGGYASLIEVMEEELIARGVRIHKQNPVQAVQTEGNKAKGVTAAGRFIPFDAVVMNGEFPLMASLVQKKPKKYVPSSGCVLFYFGLNKKYEQGEVHQFFMGEDFQQHMKQVFSTKEVPTDPSFYTFYPSLIDPSLAPEGKSVLYVLVPVPSGTHINWEKETAFQERMLNEIERRAFPKLREAVEWMEVRTPKEAAQFGLYEGGSFGIAPAFLQSGVFRPQYKPFEYENVFAAGASVHPGGGIPVVMQGAKLLADYLIEEKSMVEKGGGEHGHIKKSVSSL
jgi:phytoene desaturase